MKFWIRFARGLNLILMVGTTIGFYYETDESRRTTIMLYELVLFLILYALVKAEKYLEETVKEIEDIETMLIVAKKGRELDRRMTLQNCGIGECYIILNAHYSQLVRIIDRHYSTENPIVYAVSIDRTEKDTPWPQFVDGLKTQERKHYTITMDSDWEVREIDNF